MTDSGPQALEHRKVKVKVRKGDGSIGTVDEDLWRTNEGYVAESPATLMLWTPASVWAIRDANAEHLRTIDTFLEMGKARDVRDLLRRQDRAAGMPWVNTTAADRNGDVLYADHSVVPNVSNALAQQCMTAVGQVLFQLAGLPGLDGTRAGSSCSWRHRRGRRAAGHLRPREPARRGPPRLRDERQRLLLDAERVGPARGLRPDHRLRAVRAHDAHPDGHAVRRGPARPQRRRGQGEPAQPPPPRAREPVARRRGDAGRQRPRRRCATPPARPRPAPCCRAGTAARRGARSARTSSRSSSSGPPRHRCGRCRSTRPTRSTRRATSTRPTRTSRPR